MGALEINALLLELRLKTRTLHTDLASSCHGKPITFRCSKTDADYPCTLHKRALQPCNIEI